MLGNQVDVASIQVGEAIENIQSGKLVPLAVFGPERISYLPDVPTAKEQGLDVEVTQYRFMTVPKGTPQEAKDKLADALKATFATEDYKKFNEQNSLTPMEVPGDDGAHPAQRGQAALRRAGPAVRHQSAGRGLRTAVGEPHTPHAHDLLAEIEAEVAHELRGGAAARGRARLPDRAARWSAWWSASAGAVLAYGYGLGLAARARSRSVAVRGQRAHRGLSVLLLVAGRGDSTMPRSSPAAACFWWPSARSPSSAFGLLMPLIGFEIPRCWCCA